MALLHREVWHIVGTLASVSRYALKSQSLLISDGSAVLRLSARRKQVSVKHCYRLVILRHTTHSRRMAKPSYAGNPSRLSYRYCAMSTMKPELTALGMVTIDNIGSWTHYPCPNGQSAGARISFPMRNPQRLTVVGILPASNTLANRISKIKSVRAERQFSAVGSSVGFELGRRVINLYDHELGSTTARKFVYELRKKSDDQVAHNTETTHPLTYFLSCGD